MLEIHEITTCAARTAVAPIRSLIETMQREFLDHALFWNARDLERKLAEFQAYDNAARSHASLKGFMALTFADKQTIPPVSLSHVRWISHWRGIVHSPSAPENEFETDALRTDARLCGHQSPIFSTVAWAKLARNVVVSPSVRSRRYSHQGREP